MRRRLIAAQAPLLALAVLLGGATAADRPTPSGMPVPRYVSLKFDRVNARAGPGDDHRLLFVYTAKGLPVQVVAETSDWRRVCDPDGTLAWVHKRTTDGRRTVMNTKTDPMPLLRKAREGAPAAAYLAPKALAQLVRCSKDWCRVKAGGRAGWVKEGDLWGTSDALQCH